MIQQHYFPCHQECQMLKKNIEANDGALSLSANEQNK